MGIGRREKPLFAGLDSPAIAHHELAASARDMTFDVGERDFPMNRSPPRWKFVPRSKRKSAQARSALLFKATTSVPSLLPLPQPFRIRNCLLTQFSSRPS